VVYFVISLVSAPPSERVLWTFWGEKMKT